jgi:hypothetical protein
MVLVQGIGKRMEILLEKLQHVEQLATCKRKKKEIISISLYTGCFFSCLTYMRWPNAPPDALPALCRGPHVGHVNSL